MGEQNKLDVYAREKAEEYYFLKEMILEKYKMDEMNLSFLDRIIEHVYWTGHYVGHCRGEKYKRDLIEGYEKKINELESELYAKY